MIQILDSKTINKIAAGEVIDRPVSVVKELLDNALDAGATLITITIKNGGKTLISVQDNGGGILKDDIPKAPLQHATSKINKVEDLFETPTLGFRGEALSSIGHVSELTISSRTAKDDSGHSIHMANGDTSPVTPIAHEIGTTVLAENIFDNIPVRQRFLKTSATEFSYIYELVLHYAFVFPTIDFVLIHDGKESLNSSGLKNYKQLTHHFFGKKVAEQAEVVDYTIGDVHFTGILSLPSLTYSNRNKQFFSVNQRLVKSNVLYQAIKLAYKDNIPANRFPFVYLNLDVPPSLIDINIHPQKQDIKFLSPGFVFDCIPKVVNMTLANANVAQQIFPSENLQQSPVHSTTEQQGRHAESSLFEHTEQSQQRGNTFGTTDPSNLSAQSARGDFSAQSAPGSFSTKPAPGNFSEQPTTGGISAHSAQGNSPARPQSPSFEPKPFQKAASESPTALFQSSSLKQLEADRMEFLQVFNTYLIVKSESGLWMLDQHAVHERILYEKIKKAWGTKTEKQPLLISEIIDLDPELYAIFMDNTGYFSSLSFDIEDFGQDRIIVREIPMVLTNTNIKELVIDILSQLKLYPYSTTDLTLEQKEKLQMMACKAAIKAGKPLSTFEMKHLIKTLIKSPSNFTCPHGRPLFIKFDKEKLESLFARR